MAFPVVAVGWSGRSSAAFAETSRAAVPRCRTAAQWSLQMRAKRGTPFRHQAPQWQPRNVLRGYAGRSSHFFLSDCSLPITILAAYTLRPSAPFVSKGDHGADGGRVRAEGVWAAADIFMT